MATGQERAPRRASPHVIPPAGIEEPSSIASVGAARSPAVVTTEDVDWLVRRLQAMVTACPAVWAGRGMTLLQLITLHLISALAPVAITDLAQALGTRLPATSAMIDRLAHLGLVHRTMDPQDRRRIQLTVTAAAQPIVGDTDAATARRLQALLDRMGSQTRRPLVDLLIDTVRRCAEQPGASPI